MFLFVVDRLESESDKALISKLYQDFMPLLRARAYKMVNDYNVSNDLAHDCMVNIIKHVDYLGTLSESRQRAYMTVAIDNICKNYLKKNNRQMTGVADDSGSYTPDIYSVEEEVERKYDYQTMRRGFENLREKDKHIMIMKYDLELNDAQIAETLDIKKDSVRMTVRRAIAKLKDEIKKLEE